MLLLYQVAIMKTILLIVIVTLGPLFPSLHQEDPIQMELCLPLKNHDYATMSGTSMAAPHVSASLALLQQAFPQLSNETHLASLKATATDINLNGKDNYYGHGLLNINESLKYTDESPPELTHQEKTFQELSSTIIITANVIDDFQSTTYPIVTLNYQFILESNNNESSWETTHCDITKPNVLCTLTTPSKSIQLNYYLIATDYSQKTTRLPTNTDYFSISLKDITAPTIYFFQPTKPLTTTSILSYSLSDQSSINANSLTITLSTSTQDYVFTNLSKEITLSNKQLQINLTLLELTYEDLITINISIADEYNNTQYFSHQLSLYSLFQLQYHHQINLDLLLGLTP